MTNLKENSDAPPIIEYTRFAKMGEGLDLSTSIEGKIIRMPIDDLHPSPVRANKKLMDPFPENIKKEKQEEGANTGEGTDSNDYSQQEKYKEIGKKSSRQKDEAYLRLTLHVEDGKMSLIQAHKVDGPLIIEDRIDGNLAYEVILSSKRIALGSIMDVGVLRSFPNPYGVPGQEGHFFVELPSYEFDVRIPAKDLSISLLPNEEIRLYEVKTPISKIIDEKSLGDQFRNELNEVSRLKGINIQTLSQRSQTEIYNLFR